MRPVLTLLPLSSASLLCACSFAPSIPVSVVTPAVDVDVDAERTALEDAVCRDAGSQGCGVIAALDESDDGVAADPPRLPRLLPFDILAHGAKVNVARWLESQRAVHDVVPAVTVPVDLGAFQLAASEIRSAHVVDAKLTFGDDTLTIDLPALRIAVQQGDGEPVDVAAVAPHSGGSGEDAAVFFADGGTDALLAAVATGNATLTVHADSDAPLGLLAGPTQETLERPGGAAQVALAVTLDITTSLSTSLDAAGVR